jgi:hypothetical protein
MKQITKNVIEDYLNFISIKEICEMYKISRSSFYRLLKKEGVIKHKISDWKKNKFNEDYFSQIDNSEKAYWLGVLYADGCVKSGSNSITLSSIDYEWLLQYKESISFSGNIKKEFHKKYKKIIYKCEVYSEKTKKDLISIGCVPRKSLILTFPEIKKEFASSFIRGYFDGDGSVGMYFSTKRNKKKSLQSSICSGSEQFLIKLSSYLPTNNKNILRKKDKLFCLSFRQKDSLSLYEFLYEIPGYYLARKKDIFDTFKRDVQSTQ